MAKKKTIRQMSAGGCLIEVCGVGSLVMGFLVPPMFIAGLVLLIVGAKMTYKKICSDCGNPVEKTAKVCPTCAALFGKHKPPEPIQNTTPGRTICQLCENLLTYEPRHSGRVVKCKYCEEPVTLN